MLQRLLNDFNIDVQRIEKYLPFYRHFKIIEHENITPLTDGIYHVKAKYHGINGQCKTLPNLVVNQLIHNELSFNLNKTPVYCRYDYTSGANSKHTEGKYFRVIPIGNFTAYQSNLVKDIGLDLYLNLPTIRSKIFSTKTVNNLDSEIIDLINKYVQSYQINNHQYNNYEVLLDCDSFLLFPTI